MNNNVNSPLAVLKRQIQQMVSSLNHEFYDYCYFLPMYGLGDKIAFVSALGHLRSRNIKIAIIAQREDPLVFIYESVADLLIFSDQQYSPWLHADNYVDYGNVCSMWHLPYCGGIFEKHGVSENQKGALDSVKGGHKIAVKLCYNIDITLPLIRPSVLDQFQDATVKDYIFISPIANSSKSMRPETLKKLAHSISDYGLRVVLNTANRNQISSYYQGIGDFEVFSGDVHGALAAAGASKLAINMRSGISDLHSAIGLNFLDVYPDAPIPFWSLEEKFFTPPLAELSEDDGIVENIMAIIKKM